MTIKVDPAGISELGEGTRTWSYTITAEGMTTQSGTFSSTNTGETALGTFCGPLDTQITVKITQTSGPPPPTPPPDPTHTEDTVTSGSAYQSDYNDPPDNATPDSSPSSDDSASGPCLLKLTWCGGCSDPGETCAKLGTSTFDIPKNPCGGEAGDTCAASGSVDFRINLGRGANGRSVVLVIHEDTIADALDPLNVKYPGIADVYELEIWHWFGYTRTELQWVGPDPDDIGGLTSHGVTGHQYVYKFVGKQGYVDVFQKLNMSPVGRNPVPYLWGPPLPSGEEVYLNETSSNGGRRVVSFENWGQGMASNTYFDGVKELPNSWSRNTSSLGVPISSAALEVAPSGSLEDYVRRHFQQRQPFLAIGHADITTDIPDPVTGLYGTTDAADRVKLCDLAALPDSAGSTHSFFTGIADPINNPPETHVAPPICFGATYTVRKAVLGVPGDVGVLPGSGGNASSVGPEVVVKIEPSTPAGSGYIMKGFWRSQVSANVSGQVVFNGLPFATWSVTRPQTNQFLITETRNFQTVATYLWQESGTTWTLTTTKGDRQEVHSKVANSGGWIRTVTVTDLSENRVVSKVETVTNSAGDLVSTTQGIVADGQLVTTYGYDGTGKLTHFTRNDGSFEIYKTHVDSAGTYGGGTFEATIRPWQGLAFNAGLTISQGAVTLTKTVLSGAQETRTSIELINGVVMSTTVSISTNRSMDRDADPWLKYRLPLGATLPVRRTVTTRTASALPGVPEVSISEVFTAGAPASLAGRPAYRKDADGKVTVYHHYRSGTYSPMTGTVQQGGENGDRVVFEVTYDGRTSPFGYPLFQSDSTMVITDAQGHVLRKNHLTWATGGQNNHLVRLSWTKNAYDEAGRLIQTSVHTDEDNSIIYSASYDQLGRKEMEIDATGSQTIYSDFNAVGSAQTVTEQAYGAWNGLPAIPERVLGMEVDVAGNSIQEVRGPFISERVHDSRGRVKQEFAGTHDNGAVANQRTTFYSRTMNGVNPVETTTHPSGATTITETYPDGQMKSVTGTAQPSQLVERFVNGSGFSTVGLPSGLVGGFVVEQTSTAGEISAIRIQDGLGRLLADYVLSFNASQQLAGSWRTYSYDSAGRITHEYLAGELVRQVVHGWGGDSVETIYASPNPNQVRSTVTQYSLEPTGWHRVTITSEGTQREKLFGEGSALRHMIFTDLYNRETTQSVTIPGSGIVTTTVYSPEANNPSITIARGGFAQSMKGPSTDPTIYTYDGLGRQTEIAAPGGIETTIAYDELYGQPATITTTGDTLGENATTLTSMTYYPPGSAAPGQVQTRTVDGKQTNYSYYSDGSLKAIWGADYPQRYEYFAGRLHRLHTYRSAPPGEPTGNGDITEWTYKFGLLWKKTDAASKAVTYSYNNKGRLVTRTWARGVSTTYSHDRAGQLTGINYSDATPDVTFMRDSKGRLTYVASVNGDYQSNYGYGTQFAAAGTESTFLDPYGSTEFFQLTRTRLGNLSGPTIEHRTTGVHWNGIDTITGSTLDSRVYETTGGALGVANNVTLARNPATAQILSATHPQAGGGPVLKATFTPDGLGRLKRVETGIQAGATKAFMEYTYVSGQREQAATDRGTWHYSYNGRGEVTSGTKKITNTSVPGYSFGYQFDGIGNRETATTNGVTDVYTPNAVNQYEQRTVPAYFQVRGVAKAIPVTPPAIPVDPEGVAVKLEGAQSPYTAAAFGPANYFGLALPVPAPGNQSNALWKDITIEAWANNATNEYKVTETRKDFLPKSPEDYDYDFDGNLIKDGRWTYEWDGENRLIRMTARTADFPGGELPPGIAVWMVEFKYDWQGRRTTKNVFDYQGVTQLSGTRYFYDGWALVFEVERHFGDAFSGQVVTRAYTWGPDVSGEVAGAGGVGGLQRVEVVHIDQNTPEPTIVSHTWIPAYDGNGNIVAYLDQATGNIVQEEEYGPFGESLRSRSTSVIRCPIGWSTKYTDEESGLVYYGYRYYAPQVGRWISRDPSGEDGGMGLQSYVGNHSTHNVDFLGLWKVDYGLRNPYDSRLMFESSEGFALWRSFEKATLQADMDRIKERIPKLIDRTEELYKSTDEICCEDYRIALRIELKNFKKVLERMRIGMNSGLRLPIIKESTGADRAGRIGFFGSDPKDDDSPQSYMNLMFIGLEMSYFVSSTNDRVQTVFHELSHIEGTKDNDSKGIYMQAQNIELLITFKHGPRKYDPYAIRNFYRNKYKSVCDDDSLWWPEGDKKAE